MHAPDYKTVFLFLSLAPLSLSCSNPKTSENSKVKGHYESFSDYELQLRRGRQAIVAEYETQQAVIIAAEAMTTDGFNQLLSGFFESGLKSVFMMMLAQETLQPSDIARLEAAAGGNIGKIKITDQSVWGHVTLWARDWAPLTAFSTIAKNSSQNTNQNRDAYSTQSNDPTKPVMLDFNYYLGRRR